MTEWGGGIEHRNPALAGGNESRKGRLLAGWTLQHLLFAEWTDLVVGHVAGPPRVRRSANAAQDGTPDAPGATDTGRGASGSRPGSGLHVAGARGGRQS